MGRLAAAVLALMSLIVACGDESARGDAVGTSSSPTTTTSDTMSSTPPATAPGSTLVMASPTGVEVLSAEGDSTHISARPAGGAYAVGTDLVVFQGAEPRGDVFPPGAVGPVMVWSAGEVRDLPTDPGASRAFLLDAAVVDEVPVALVAERFGEVGPDDTFEALVRIDLRDDTRTTIVRRPAWESGHSAARFLPEGDVIGLFGSEATVLLARWSSTSEEALWTVEVGVDTYRDLTLRNGEITLIQSTFDSAGPFTTVLTLTTHDEATGDEEGSRSVDIRDSGGEIDTGVFCRDWASPSTLVCGRDGDVAVSVSVDDGSFRLLPSEPGAIPTAVRPR